MNLSRFIYFETLINIILKELNIWNFIPFWTNQRSLKLFLSVTNEEIHFQIQKIELKQDGGYWPIATSDQIFINYLQKTSTLITELLEMSKLNYYDYRFLSRNLRKLLNHAKEEHKPKIKTVFLLQETVAWPSFESVYEAFHEDTKCVTHLIYLPFEHVNNDKSRDWFAEYRELRIPVISYKDYDLSKESPDLIFFMKPYDGIPMQFFISNVEKIVKRSVYIPYFVNWMAFPNIPYLIDYHFRQLLHSVAWKIFDAPSYVRNFHAYYGYRNGENVVIGHPRFDSRKKLGGMKKQIPFQWKKKITGRTVIMWNSHVTMGSKTQNEMDWSTFEQIGKELISFFITHKEFALLWRPHPSFFMGLLNNGIMTESDVDEIKKNVEDSENIILDTTSDYRFGFSVTDALISDASSLLVEYLITGKPVLYTYRPKTFSIVNEHLIPAYDVACKWEEVEHFIENVGKGLDSKSSERKNVVNEIGILENENIGRMVKKICIEGLLTEEKKSAKSIIEKWKQRNVHV